MELQPPASGTARSSAWRTRGRSEVREERERKEVGGHKAARPCGWLPREREEGGRRRKALWCFRERKREREARVGESKGG